MILPEPIDAVMILVIVLLAFGPGKLPYFAEKLVGLVRRS